MYEKTIAMNLISIPIIVFCISSTVWLFCFRIYKHYFPYDLLGDFVITVHVFMKIGNAM